MNLRPRTIRLLTSCLLLSPFALAAGSIAGTYHGPAGVDVRGTVIFACLPVEAGCDEAGTPMSTVETSGTSAPFEFTNLQDTSYLLIAWQDRNGNGEPDEDELSVYSGPDGQPAYLTPPATGIVFGAAQGVQQNEAAQGTGGAGNVPAAVMGSWYQGTGSTIDYYNPTTGTWAPPSGTGFRYTFTPDGRYVYSGMLQTSMYGCTSTLYSYKEGRAVAEGEILMLIPDRDLFRSSDNCNAEWNYEKEEADPQAEYFLWNIAPDPYTTSGQVLELTDLILLPDGTLDYEGEEPQAAIFFRE